MISIAQARQLWPRDVKQPVLAHTAGDLHRKLHSSTASSITTTWALHLNFKRSQELKAFDLPESMGSLPWVEKATKHSKRDSSGEQGGRG